jgi:hypothetical protein
MSLQHTYGHLFKDSEFTKQQVGLLETALGSVRSPLERVHQDTTDTTEQSPIHLKSQTIITAGISHR